MWFTFNVATTFRYFSPLNKNQECLIKEHLKSSARALQINNINKCNVCFDSNSWKYKNNDNTNMIQVIFMVVKTTETIVILRNK